MPDARRRYVDKLLCLDSDHPARAPEDAGATALVESAADGWWYAAQSPDRCHQESRSPCNVPRVPGRLAQPAPPSALRVGQIPEVLHWDTKSHRPQVQLRRNFVRPWRAEAAASRPVRQRYAAIQKNVQLQFAPVQDSPGDRAPSEPPPHPQTDAQTITGRLSLAAHAAPHRPLPRQGSASHSPAPADDRDRDC